MSSKKLLNIYDDGNIPDVDLPNGEDSKRKNFKVKNSLDTTYAKTTSSLPKSSPSSGEDLRTD